MNIIQDTREKNNKHNQAEDYFKKNNIKILRTKLPFGDYALYGDFTLVVDFKANLLEIAGNLTKDHARFKREIIGANDFGTGIVILIEEDKQYTFDTLITDYKIPTYKNKGWKTLPNGKKTITHYAGQPMAQFNIETVVKIMKTMQERYAVLFEFTTKENCGKKIIDILYNNRDYYKEYFNNKLQSIKNDKKEE